MKKSRSQKGFIMITSLIVISLAVAIVAYLINRSTSYMPYIKTVIDREKAKELANGGLQMAMSQLAYADVGEEKAGEQKKSKSSDKKIATDQSQTSTGQKAAPQDNKEAARSKIFLKKLLPILNSWQTFKFEHNKDGIDGEIKIYIMSEDGKLNLNELYDFSKHAFVGQEKEAGELKKVCEELLNKIKKVGEGASIFEGLQGAFKERNSRLRDVTELLTIKAFEPFKMRVFYDPDEVARKDGKEKALYLTDIFTIWSTHRSFDPWLISPSLKIMLGLESEHDKKTFVEEALKSFKASYSWPDDWNNIFVKLYKKDFASLPKGISHLLRTSFGPETFSVLSYGKVGDITHRLFAILVRDTEDRPDDGPARVHLKKLYWI